MGKSQFSRFISSTPKCDIVTTTKEFVDWALSINLHNREVTKKKVGDWKKAMENHEWELTSQGIGISRDGELLNGQHRMLANKAAGYPPIQVVVVYGLDPKAQYKEDIGIRRTYKAMMEILHNIRLSSVVSGSLRILARGKVPHEDISLDELSDAYTKYEGVFNLVQIPHKTKGLGGGFAAAVFQALYDGMDTGKVQKFVDQVRTGFEIPHLGPAGAYRQMFIEGRSTGAQEPGYIGAKIALARFMADKKLSADKLNAEIRNEMANDSEETSSESKDAQ